MEISFHAIAAAERIRRQQLQGELLAWRDRLQAATNLPDEAFAFIVRPEDLIGVAEFAGSQVIHRGEIVKPMVALILPD